VTASTRFTSFPLFSLPFSLSLRGKIENWLIRAGVRLGPIIALLFHSIQGTFNDPEMTGKARKKGDLALKIKES
jgi:hypothetical protein